MLNKILCNKKARKVLVIAELALGTFAASKLAYTCGKADVMDDIVAGAKANGGTISGTFKVAGKMTNMDITVK